MRKINYRSETGNVIELIEYDNTNKVGTISTNGINILMSELARMADNIEDDCAAVKLVLNEKPGNEVFLDCKDQIIVLLNSLDYLEHEDSKAKIFMTIAEEILHLARGLV